MITSDEPGLYIHVPFCVSKCGYCSFYSTASIQSIPEYVKAVVSETALYRHLFRSFDTIYLGGGTPSLLAGRQIEDILSAVGSHFKIALPCEITLEANPGDLSLDYLRSLGTLGINRLNLGIQSYDDGLLQFLGRRHTSKEAATALEAAAKAGFNNIGVDLIYGIYGQSIKSWKQTLQKALRFSPEHLSCYQLSLGEQTPLYKRYSQDGLRLPSENEALDFFTLTSDVLTEAGYVHYEVSNFARSDALKSRHNVKYWRHVPYLGLGPAAHSFLDGKRWWNKSTVKSYLKDISDGVKPVEKSERLSLEQLALETLFLGMRTREGVDLKRYKRLYGSDLLFEKRLIIDELMSNNLVQLKGDRLCPTRAGMAMADSLALI